VSAFVIGATKDILKGQKLSKKNIFPRRPGIGDFLAKDYKMLIGKTARINIKNNTLIKIEHHS